MARLMYLCRSRALRLCIHMDVPRLWRATSNPDDFVQAKAVCQRTLDGIASEFEGDCQEFYVSERFRVHLSK